MTERVDELRELAATAVLAALASVPPGLISPRYWWPRAASALGTAANAAGSWSQFASRLARKLQVETYGAESGEQLRMVERRVGPDLSLFLRLCREETEWVIVEARAMREERRTGNADKD